MSDYDDPGHYDTFVCPVCGETCLDWGDDGCPNCERERGKKESATAGRAHPKEGDDLLLRR